MEKYENAACANGCMVVKRLRGKLVALVRQGQRKRLRVEKDGKLYVDVPVNLGVAGLAGTMLSTPLTMVAVGAAVLAWSRDYRLEITDAAQRTPEAKTTTIDPDYRYEMAEALTQELMDDYEGKL